MTMKITTHYKEALTSQMLNYKVETMVGENKVVEGFEVSKNNNNITISPGKCIINGAIIESDEDVTIEVPHSLQGSSDFQVIAKYSHSAKSVNFYVYEIGRSLDGNELLLSKSMTDASKIRTLTDLSASLKSIKENLAEDQVLEYENEFIISTDSVEGATTELKIKGQTIVNVAPIKDEVDVYADLQATGNGSVKFNNTGDGIIDGINIKGKSYQNVIQKDAFKNKGNFIKSSIDVADGYISLTANGTYRNAYLKLDKAKLKLNTKYTIILEILSTTINGMLVINSDNADYSPGAFTGKETGLKGEDLRTGIYKYSLTTKSSFDGVETALRVFVDKTATEGSITFRYAIVEGDHVSNPDLNNYFEGIIGVGDNSESGYKIDILSCGQNLADISTSGNTNFEIGHIKKGQSYSLKFVKDRKDIKYNLLYKENNIFSNIDGCVGKSAEFITFVSDRDAILWYNAHATDNISEIMLVEGICTSDNMPPFKPYECDDEQILLQEPLHSLSSNVYDEIVGDKIIRRVGKIVLNGNEHWTGYADQTTKDTLLFQTQSILSATGVPNDALCDEFILPQYNKSLWGKDINYEGIRVGRANGLGVDIRINKSRLATEDVNGLKQWLRSNPLTFYYQLQEPVITPVDGNCILPNGVHDRVVDNEIERNVGKISLDGSETWSLLSGNEENIAFSLSLPDVKTDASSICNTLPHSSAVNPPAPCFNILDKLYIRVLKTDLTSNTVEGFKEWLTQNPTTIWYELNTPYYEPTSKPKLKSFAPETNIIGSTFVPTPFNIESYGYRKEALIKPNTQYTIHFNNKYVDADFKNIKVDLGGATGNVTANNSWLMLKLTTPATLAHKELRISGYGIKVSNVMCSEGSEYRDFIDGLASMGDKSKNLFNYKTCLNGFTLDSNTGLPISRDTRFISDFIEVNEGTSILVKVTGSFQFKNLWAYNSNKEPIRKMGVEAFQEKTFVIPSEVKYIRFPVGTLTNEVTTEAMMKKADILVSSSIKNYQPYYDGHKIEILSYGKNLINLDDMPFGSLGDSGKVVMSPTSAYKVTPNFIKIEPTRKFCFYYEYDENDTSTPEHNMIAYYDENFSYIGASYDWPPRGIVTTPPVKACYLRLRVRKEAVKSSLIFGSSIIYEPYTEDKTQILLQEPLRSLPNGVCDTIEEVDGNYVVVRRCGEVLLDGSESWSKNTSLDGTETVFFYRTQTGMSEKWIIPYSNNFLGVTDRVTAINTNKEFCMTGDGVKPLVQILIKSNRLVDSSIQSFQKWLSQNPTKVVYQLATPIIHPFDAIKLPYGTCDEIQDGKRIRKVGKIIYDGTEAWENYGRMSSVTYENTIAFKLPFPINNPGDNNNLLSNNFATTSLAFANDIEGLWERDGIIRVVINKSKLSTPDVAGFKKWLSQNPTTVWYELAKPTEEDYNSRNLNLNTYDEVTHITSNTLVPAIINAKIPSTIGSVIKNDIERIEKIEDWIDKVILPSLVESHYQKTLLEFDYVVSRMLK